jgi:hypothetical protein
MPIPAPYNPKNLHLWVDNVTSLLTNSTNFFQLIDNNCINTFTMYQIPTITSQVQSLGNFICEAKTNHGVCSVAGIINPYDWTPPPAGTRNVQSIVNYNNNPITQANSCRRIDYLTIESEFWNIDDPAINPVVSNGCTINIAANSSTGTVSGCLGGVTAGMIIKVSVGATFVYRQIIGISGNIVTFDRVFDPINAYLAAPFTVINNQTFYGIDFETLLYRIKYNIRPMAIANNLLPLEIYVSRALTSDQFERLIPHVDRLLIEVDYNQLSYPRYNDNDVTNPSWSTNTIKNALSLCSVIRTGTISIAQNSNIVTGSGTLFTRDLGEQSQIIVNGNQIYTIATIISDTQATIVGTSPINITAGSTYASYFDYMPIFYTLPAGAFGTPLRRQWMLNPSPKSYADVYRFHSQNAYTAGGSIQVGNTPIAFNNETDPYIVDSVSLVGLSLFVWSSVSNLSPVAPPDYPCPPCSGETIIGCEVTAITTSNCLIATYTNPACDGVCDGTISASTTYGIAPFTYYITGITNSITYVSSTGFFSGLCEDTYILCVTDSASNTECYYQNIELVNTFYASINSFLNGFCVTISGGTGIYYVYKDNQVLPWDYNNTTNCYSADCSTLSVITVRDTSTL